MRRGVSGIHRPDGEQVVRAPRHRYRARPRRLRRWEQIRPLDEHDVFFTLFLV